MKYLIAISLLILTSCSGPKKVVAPPPTGGWDQYPILLGGQGFKLVLDSATEIIKGSQQLSNNVGLSINPVLTYSASPDRDPVLKGLDTIKVFLLCNRSYDWGDGDFITTQRSGYEIRKVLEHEPPNDNMCGEKSYIYYEHVKYLDSKYQEFKDWYVWMSRPVPEKLKKK